MSITKPFLPNKLPNEKIMGIQEKMLGKLIEAHRLIATYNATLKYSKISAELLFMPLCVKEASSSTRIEGTQVTVDGIFAFEANSNAAEDRDIQEAINYMDALRWASKVLKSNQLPISTRMYKQLHVILMSKNVRGKNKSPGEFRKIQNFISTSGQDISKAQFVPPEPHLVDEYISNLDIFINDTSKELDALVKIAIIHSQFETIHPFLDGNGRVGRMLVPLYLYDSKVIEHPYFFVSEELEKDKFKYYAYLNDTRYKDDLYSWVDFFITCIINQSRKSIRTVEQINEQFDIDINSAKKYVDGNIVYDIFQHIYIQPVFTAKKLAQELDINYSRCLRILNKLEANKIIFSDNAKRNKNFFHYNLLSILR